MPIFVSQHEVKDKLGLDWDSLTKEQKDYFGDGTCPDGYPTVEGFTRRFGNSDSANSDSAKIENQGEPAVKKAQKKGSKK